MIESNPFYESLDTLCDAVNGDRRKESHLTANTPAEITGIDRAGHIFNEHTVIQDVTEVGCRFDARTQLRCGDIVAVKALAPGEKVLTQAQPQLFEVMWAANRGTGCTVGTRKLQGEKLANVKFPPANYSSRRPAK